MFARSVLFDIGFNIKDKKLKRANKDVSILKRNVKSGSSHFATLGATGYTAGDKLKTAFANVGRTMKSGVATLRKYRMQILATTAAFGGFIALSIKKAGDAQETLNKFNVVFGNTSTEVRKWATQWADSVGRSRNATLNWLNSFQDILVPMGLSRKVAGGLSKDMVKLAGDLGSFNNVSTESAARAMQSALMGQHRAVRKLGISLNQAGLDALALSKGYEKNFKDLDALTKMQLRFEEMKRQSKDADNDLIRTKDSLNNQLQQLKANFNDAAAEIGKNFVPASAKLIKSVNGVLKKFKDPEWAKTASRFTSIGLGIGGLAFGIPILAKIAGFIKVGFVTAFTGAAGIISAAIGVIIAGWLALDDALAVFRGEESLLFDEKSANKFIDVLADARKIVWNIGGAFQNLGYFIFDVFKMLSKFGNIFMSGFSLDSIREFGQTFIDMGNHIWGIFKEIGLAIHKLLKAVGIDIVSIFNSVWNWIKTAFKNVIQFIGKQIAGLINIFIGNINRTIGLYNTTLGKITGQIDTIQLIGPENKNKTTPITETPVFKSSGKTENKNYNLNLTLNGSATEEEKEKFKNEFRNMFNYMIKQEKAEVQG